MFAHISLQDFYIGEGNLEVKLPTIWTDGKAEVGRKKESTEEKSEKREEKFGRKVTKHLFPNVLGV